MKELIHVWLTERELATLARILSYTYNIDIDPDELVEQRGEYKGAWAMSLIERLCRYGLTTQQARLAIESVLYEDR
jgi:hypothetical protein